MSVKQQHAGFKTAYLDYSEFKKKHAAQLAS
jgi:hypothetical protein